MRADTLHGGGQQDLERRIRGLERRLRKLAVKLSQAEELVDGVTFDLVEIQEGFSATGSMTRPKSDADEKVAEHLAGTGVKKVEIERRNNGSARVRIDELQELDLPPTLTDLLHILCLDTGQSSEDELLVGFKTAAEVRMLLAAKQGRSFSNQAVRNLVWRLREALREGKCNPYLIQTSPTGGYRFALRRKGALVIPQSHV